MNDYYYDNIESERKALPCIDVTFETGGRTGPQMLAVFRKAHRHRVSGLRCITKYALELLYHFRLDESNRVSLRKPGDGSIHIGH